jgi:hypothetical protein
MTVEAKIFTNVFCQFGGQEMNFSTQELPYNI